jgi:RNA polymerase sigma factor (sigma-70 family)
MNATQPLGGVVRHLRRAAFRRDAAQLTDGELLECYIRHRDETAFADLVRRHGPMVLGVCRRVLGQDADAEDAFQATFLVLVRKARAVRPRGLVGNWLYGVAHNTARKAKAMRGVRSARERSAGIEALARRPRDGRDPLHELLDEELAWLPEKYRVPIVCCDLEGRTISDAAAHLGWPQGTVAGRLARARSLLARRLSQRGVTYSAAAVTSALALQAASASVGTSLTSATVAAARAFATGASATAVDVPPRVLALTDGVLKAMLLNKLKAVSLVLLLAVLGLVGVGAGLEPPTQAQSGAGEPPAEKKTSKVPAAAWPVRLTLEGHQDRVYAVTYSRDGTRVATSSSDGTVYLWDAQTGQKRNSLDGHESAVNGVAFAPDGKTVATAGEDKTARLWDVRTGRELRRVTHHDPVNVVAFTPDGKTLIAAGGVYNSSDDTGRGELRLWDTTTGREQKAIAPALPRGIYNLLLDASGKVLITASGNAFTVWDWDEKNGLKERHSDHADESGFVYGMALSPDGKTLAITWDAKIHLYDMATGQRRITLEKSYVGVWGPLTFAPDGKTVVATIVMQDTADGWVWQRGSLLRTWDAATGKVRQTQVLKETIAAMAFAPDGKDFAIGCRGGVRFPDGKFIDFSRLETEKDGSVKLLSVSAR